MSKTSLSLCRKQLEAIQNEARELLIYSDGGGPAGRSFALRVAALKICADPSLAGVQVSLSMRHWAELESTHVYGRSGLISLVSGMRQDGVAKIYSSEIRFKHNDGDSILRWAPCADKRQVHAILRPDPDVLLIDDVEHLPEGFYQTMADHILAGGNGRSRVIATTKAPKSSWVNRRWFEEPGDEAETFELPEEDLDDDLKTSVGESVQIEFPEFCALAMPGFRWVKYREVIAEACEKLINGELYDGEDLRIDRLMIRAPAQAGKSTLVQLLAAWWLYCNPHLTAAVSTYSQEKANEFSYMVRQFFEAAGGRIRGDSSGVRRWRTEDGGGFWATSPDASGAGQPANLLIEDDLDKDLAHALQPRHRKMVREIWYAPVWLQRWAAEHGRLIEINIGTPHDIEDSQSYILKSTGVGEEGASRNWHMVALQAIYDPDNYPIEVPDGTVVSPDWREIGEPLEPDLAKFTLSAIEAFKKNMSAPSFAAMMQCTPLSSAGGGVLQMEWFVQTGKDPGLTHGDQAFARQSRAWDFGHTEGGGDWTSGTKTGAVASTGHLLVRHSIRAQKSSAGVKRLVTLVSIMDGSHVPVRIPDDPSAGKSWASDVVEYLREVYGWLGLSPPLIEVKKVSGNKMDRAQRIVNRVQPPRPDQPVDETNRGTLDLYSGEWSPHLPDVVPNFLDLLEAAERQDARGDKDAARRFRELRAMADLARAAFGTDKESRTLRERLNIDPRPWQESLLWEAKMFDGLPGHQDDQIDSLGDSIEEVSHAASSGGALPNVPGW